MSCSAVFLDRDGVLNEPIVKGEKMFSPRSVAEFCLFDHARAPLMKLAENGFLLIVITNQPDVSRAILRVETLNAMHAKLIETMGGEQVIRDVFFCPHTSEENCACRKPKPGMLLNAAHKWKVDLKRSYLIGDRDVDMLAAQGAGCQRILLDYDYNRDVECDYRALNLDLAAEWILKQ